MSTYRGALKKPKPKPKGGGGKKIVPPPKFIDPTWFFFHDKISQDLEFTGVSKGMV